MNRQGLVSLCLALSLGCAAGQNPNGLPPGEDSGEDAEEQGALDLPEEIPLDDQILPPTFDRPPPEDTTRPPDAFVEASSDRSVVDSSSDAASDTPLDLSEIFSDIALDASDAGLDLGMDSPADSAPDRIAPDRVATDLCLAICNGSCADTDSDPRNCGGCGRDCALRPGVDTTLVRCNAGVCDLRGACLVGRANCSGNPMDGCESVVTTNARCGGCTTACTGATPVCSMVPTAPSGLGCTSGCTGTSPTRCATLCTNTDTDPRNCGACGTLCPTGIGGAGANATAACTAGRCTLTCISGYGDCDGVASNGCETVTRTNPAHCGMCGRACVPSSNATSACSLSACVLTCTPGFGNCDGDPSTGCEVNLRSSSMHCGGCNIPCAGRPNSTSVCNVSVCSLTCTSGFGNCDGLVTNGCEADVRTNPTSCGACGMRCASAPGASARCADGICGITCLTNFGNCNSNGLDGCEVSLLTDGRNCGTCGTLCPTGPNATPTCASGRCGFACSAGFGDCDGSPSTGCEASVLSSLAHCGSCGNSCNAPSNASAACTAGRCVLTCDPGYSLSGAECVRVAPRALTPTAFSVVTSRRPTFRVALPPGQDGASVEVCGNRACTSVATTLTFAGNRAVSTVALSPGTYYWRVRGSLAGSVITLPGAVSEFSVSAAGAPPTDSFWGSVLDANGDGSADMLVGLPSLNTARFYLGNTSFFSTFSFTTLSGTTSYGSAVASAGDLNADGYADALVGAPTGNTVYVYLGNASSLGSAITQTLTVPGTSRFGASVACAGDYNGDGFSDTLVGAPGSNRAYFYLGSAAGLSASPVMLSPSLGNFGTSVAGVGDLNTDGLSDFVIGTDGANAAFVYYGSAIALVSAPTMIPAPSGASGFGRAVAGVGDVNGDGYPDVLIGAYNNSAAYLYYGSASGLGATPGATLSVPGGAVQFGYSVAGLGDVSGDGLGDVLVGAPLSERAYVFFGSVSGIATSPSLTLSLATSSGFGRAVAGLGDVSRDGLFDFAVGAPTRPQVSVYRGAVGTPSLAQSLTGSTSFGSAISAP